MSTPVLLVMILGPDLIEPQYNFYFKKYEELMRNSAIDIRSIPSSHMYYFLQESLLDLDVTNYDKEYLEFLSYKKNTDGLKTI